jgi:hypothetical protein
MKPVFEECADCAAKPGAPQLCGPCLLRRREIDGGRWGGHGSGRGFGPGGRLAPMKGDVVEMAQKGGRWRVAEVLRANDDWFDVNCSCGGYHGAILLSSVGEWRWPHKKDLLNANREMGMKGPCCPACDPPPPMPTLEQEADALVKEWLSATDDALASVVHQLRHRVAPARTAALAVLIATRLNDAERGMLLTWLRRGLL